MVEQDNAAAAGSDAERPLRYGLRTHLNMLFVDHGFVRYVHRNTFRLSAGMLRTSQPLPHHIAGAARAGIRTVVNLRGRRDDCGSWLLEDAACRRHGIALVDFPVKSRDAPRKEVLHGARDLFRRIEYPALMHCKAGADRVGMMSVLYLHLHEGVPLPEALKQLGWRYGHLKAGKTGIIDAFFDWYLADAAERPIGLLDWVDTVYDPAVLKTRYRPDLWGTVLTDAVLRRE